MNSTGEKINEAALICVSEREKIIELMAEKVTARKKANSDMQNVMFLAELKELQNKADVYLMTVSELTSHRSLHEDVLKPKTRTRRAKADE